MEDIEEINQEQAEFIKNLRVNQNYSWRAVAREFADRFPEIKWVDKGNQISGMILCDAARDFFNEDVEKDNWN